MSLATVDDVRAVVTTALDDVRLQAIIDREERAMVNRLGAHYVDTSTRESETLAGGGRSLYLRRRLISVYRVTEDGEVLSQSNGDFRVWEDEGRVERLPAGALWGEVVQVLYVPYDDNEERTAVLIELARAAIERTAMRGESIAGEYSYTAPEWELLRAKLYRSLMLLPV